MDPQNKQNLGQEAVIQPVVPVQSLSEDAKINKSSQTKGSNFVLWIIMMVVSVFFAVPIAMMSDDPTKSISSISYFLGGLLLSAPFWITISLIISSFSKNQKVSRMFLYVIILYPVFLILLFFSFSFPVNKTVSTWEEYSILNYYVKYPVIPVYKSSVSNMKYSTTESLAVNVDSSLSYDKRHDTSYSVFKFHLSKGLLEVNLFLQDTLLQIAEVNKISIATSTFVTVDGNPSLDFISNRNDTSLITEGRIIYTSEGTYVLMSICDVYPIHGSPNDACDKKKYQTFINSFKIK